MTSFSFIEILSPWGDVSYASALARQKALTEQGKIGWLLFAPEPTITLGVRAEPARDVLVSSEKLASLGITVLQADRGGLVTYHGPSQCVGFPVGRLEDFTGNPRGVRAFVVGLQAALVTFLEAELTAAAALEGGASTGPGFSLVASEDGAGAGVWCVSECEAPPRRKLVALGLKFSRQGIAHGFALNLWPDPHFALVNPCGQTGAMPATLAPGPWKDPETRSRFLQRLGAHLPSASSGSNKL